MGLGAWNANIYHWGSRMVSRIIVAPVFCPLIEEGPQTLSCLLAPDWDPVVGQSRFAIVVFISPAIVQGPQAYEHGDPPLSPYAKSTLSSSSSFSLSPTPVLNPISPLLFLFSNACSLRWLYLPALLSLSSDRI